VDDEQLAETGFAFEGNWRDYAPIAFTNLLLTIVTLGIYRFWATTRTRRYLWANTRFIDDHLEWTGRGLELFLGFLLVLLLLGLPLLFLQFGAQALVLRGHAEIAGLLSLLAFFTIFYLTGVARFRAVRYRLSRTWWHGIRGGSDDGGFLYGLSHVWRTIVGYLPLGLLVPWAMMSLWNGRINRMSFGDAPFEGTGRAGPLMPRFLLFYFAPPLMLVAGFVVAASLRLDIGGLYLFADVPPWVGLIMMLLVVLGVYFLLGMIALAYYAAFLREAIDNLTWAGLEFRFEARTGDWMMLFIVDMLLVVGTLGIGLIFLEYRHWKFFITHMTAWGEIRVDLLGQSETRIARHGEGLLDAFDAGGF